MDKTMMKYRGGISLGVFTKKQHVCSFYPCLHYHTVIILNYLETHFRYFWMNVSYFWMNDSFGEVLLESTENESKYSKKTKKESKWN